jgi:signal transduction histidine kinase
MLMPENPKLESFEPLLAEALERTRRLMFELRPQILDGAGVAVALRAVADDGPWEELVFDIQVPRQSDTTETLVYRSLRELIINARKHSKATRLEVRGRQHDAYLSFDVEDNGIGFDVAEALDRTHRRLHLGLDATIERARLAGGSLSIDSTPGNGARLRLTLPVDPATRLRRT